MSQFIDDAPPTTASRLGDVAQRSFGDMLGNVADDLSTLVRQEMALAKAELKEDAVKAGKASGLFATAGVAGHMVLLFLSIALWWGLSDVTGGGWAGLIVATIWGVIGALSYVSGRAQLSKLKGLPRTAETVEKIPAALKPNRGAN
ncbi:phage holin family protein [Pilimelia columellifera]|uniref:Phage holin family protein n=1 Tax=Pilimelia columellifera subsp. columellifera TaxID=706583 RepID=A0ABN3MZ04_9ACTN